MADKKGMWGLGLGDVRLGDAVHEDSGKWDSGT